MNGFEKSFKILVISDKKKLEIDIFRTTESPDYRLMKGFFSFIYV